MGKFVSKARELRQQLREQTRGRELISLTDVAKELTRRLRAQQSARYRQRSVNPRTIGRLELNRAQEPDMEVVTALADFYQELGFDGSRVYFYDPHA